ncbi:MAG: SpaA isopeptide-forming pilin-related protein, partial [Hungatella sp.]
PRQKLQLEALKTDLETGEPLAGAVIGLYTEEDIRNAKGDTIVRAGTLLESSMTGTDGLAQFESDLPVGYR